MPSADPLSSSSISQTPSQATKPFSISISSKSKTPTSRGSSNPRKRPHSALADDPDASDSERRPHSYQLVSTFDHTAGGAINLDDAPETKAPLVIHGQGNRNWRDESRKKRGRNNLPEEERERRKGVVTSGDGDDTGGSEEVFGLTVMKRKGDEESTNNECSVGMNVDVTTTIGVAERKEKTADEEALEALLVGKKKSELVLAPVSVGGADTRFIGRDKEEDAFRTDIASRPDSASIDDYTVVPIEEFGAALLRGMGWKEGDTVGKRKDQASKPRVVERRPALLGIGAKEVPEGLEELGAWGKGAKSAKGRKPMYTKGLAPVLLKNSVTGETMTEEELQAKKEKQAKNEDEWKTRREKNLAIDKGRKKERSHQDREKVRDDRESRHSSSKGRRSRSREKDDRKRDRREEDERPSSRSSHRRYEGQDESRSSKHGHKDRQGKGERDGFRSSEHRYKERDNYDDIRSRKRAEAY
ncbi:hypothetical protein MMC19_000726 [Ptychographa xylographoides]|nr:hypothetical protein [Ptychographa xylographoides]